MLQIEIEATKGRGRGPADGPSDRRGDLERSPREVRVLVVEDEWLISMEIEAALLDFGYAVVGVASTADEAVAFAERLKPDLATMDIRLDGDRSGIEAALELYQRFGLRCLFVSAHSAPDLRQQAHAARPLGWLTKPFLSGELVHAVEAAVKDLRRE